MKRGVRGFRTGAEIGSEVGAALDGLEQANQQWTEEMVECCRIAAERSPGIQIDDVWAVFLERGSGLTVSNRMCAGAVMRRAAARGWIRKAPRPEGVETRVSHNQAGTSYWESLIYRPETPAARFDSESGQGVLF